MKNELTFCLWFDGQAKAAAEFYCSIFENSSITSENPFVVTFELNGRKMMGLNGGPHFKFNESVSLVVSCETQEEIDYYWAKLTDGGEESMCGWLKDKFGFSWQIVPTILASLMSDTDKAPRVMQAFSQMKKFNIQTLINA
ncbi:3-demethylubiquinone-9 3-methyltransferase [Emticicia oligotrophica DSM 17448]|uniref:3-demethylubiquinone-9 3-methyltransferase n=1 Tax=Emticicia oligotrophica (strain DSM 17448 / CIP 109782 / MTCC 6937 / GPTSA100-15) TaxID=929562 RepID=A0ABN4AI67_EMTOG|nr:VOC family protein [Emticicia oligotrophica]AFK01539.1 3-demethylubiquinone-9 3-methyltransferase [Emticicia oligotrophica DSM 17448]